MSKKKAIFLKYLIYAIIILALFVMQNTPGMMEIAGIRPSFLLSAAVLFAMYEGEFEGAILAMVCGLFWDFGSGGLTGANAILFLILGVGIGLLTTHLLRRTIGTALLCCAVSILIQMLVNFTFTYFIWNQAHSGMFLLTQMLPAALYSIVLSPLVFLLIRFVFEKFQIILHPEEPNSI
ncbi:MAG TPA: rod shape-determining protein MreD [Firmicutes bacterium]|nr:rod shape-determining protein MreD [Bacillota bacterium]